MSNSTNNGIFRGGNDSVVFNLYDQSFKPYHRCVEALLPTYMGHTQSLAALGNILKIKTCMLEIHGYV